jgi:4-amino-4-deoxy-L-arabinose transferase-like glycosyltransferase
MIFSENRCPLFGIMLKQGPMTTFSGFNDAIARLTDALADPLRRRRAALLLVLGYGVLWFIYGVIAKSSQDLNADMAEMIVWMREPALGYPKHPPLPAWILWAWFHAFPLTDWAYLLLSALTLAIGLFLAIELAAEWLSGTKLAAVPFLLGMIPFYNFLGLKWDQNSLLIPLWALAMWAMLRALATRHDGWAALAGLAAAAAMLTKYWSVFLVAALALTALAHEKRAGYFRSRAPWVTALVFLAAMGPHTWWLIANNFPPITWVTWRRSSPSFFETLRSFLEYSAGTAGYAIAAVALVLVFVRPSRRALADGFFPRDARRSAAILFWTPLALPAVPSFAKNIVLLSLWNTPSLNLLPVMLLGSPRLALPRSALLRLASVAVAFTCLMAVVSPVVAYVILKRGVENDAAYGRLVMQAAETEWHAVTDKPLKLVAGPFVLASTAAFYGSDQPSTFADFSPYLCPWADAARVARDGMVIVVANDSPWFDFTLKQMEAAQPVRRTEVTLTRRWLGFENTPRHFVIAVVAPKS